MGHTTLGMGAGVLGLQGAGLAAADPGQLSGNRGTPTGRR